MKSSTTRKFALAAVLTVPLLAPFGAVNGSGADGSIGPINPWGVDPAAEGTPVAGGTIVLGVPGDPIGLDMSSGGNGPATLLTAIYDSLMRVDPENMTVVPFLAESMTSDDLVTWVIGLRPDVRFHDGSPLNADAVVQSIQRHMDSPASAAYLMTRDIVAVQALDDLEVEIVLSAPNGGFPGHFVADPNGTTLGFINAPVDYDQVDRADFVPVGAGPFKFIEWIPGRHLIVEKNTDYWNGEPYLDRIEMVPMGDPETRFQAVQTGDVDVIVDFYHPSLMRAIADGNLTVYFEPAGADYLIFNMDRPPFDDHRMRAAAHAAINPAALEAVIFDGQAAPANTLLSPFEVGFVDVSDTLPAFDPDHASELVAQYVADGGTARASYSTPSTAFRRRTAEFFQAELAKVGIELELNFHDISVYNTTVLRPGDFDLATWSAPWLTTDAMMNQHYHSGGPLNHSFWNNPEVDALLSEAAGLGDQAARGEIYSQIEQLAAEDLPRYYYSRAYFTNITGSNVFGVQRIPSGAIFWADVWIVE